MYFVQKYRPKNGAVGTGEYRLYKIFFVLYRPILRAMVFVVVVCLTMAMTYNYSQKPSSSIEGCYMVWMIYDGHMITVDECGPNFLIFVLRLREIPGKPSTRKLTRPGIERGPAAILLLDHNGLPWQCMSRDRPAFGQITLHRYIHR